jgi:hypothetical protein
MLLYLTFIIRSFNVDSLVMKFIAIDFQAPLGALDDFISLYSLC